VESMSLRYTEVSNQKPNHLFCLQCTII